MLVRLIATTEILCKRIGDTAVYTKFGTRIGEGFDDIDDEFLYIPAYKLDFGTLKCICNKRMEERGQWRIVTVDGLLKRLAFQVRGSRLGYLLVPIKDAYIKVNE